MRDHERDDARFGAPECAEVELRDALPALEHGRLPDGERRRLERHLEACAACAAELALLRDVRLFGVGSAPAMDLDRIAAAVRDATVRPLAPRVGERVVALQAQRARAAGRPAWATRLTGGAGLRAAAALLIAVVGGAVVATREDEGRSPLGARTGSAAVAGAANPAATPGVPAGPTVVASGEGAHALGDGFQDLSEDEMSAVLVALEDDDAALPALEPAIQAPEFRGGGE